jgi:2-haloacid dehalogenase
MNLPHSESPTAVIFDIGGVLVDWDPRHLYRSLFESESEMEHFLSEICTPDWHNSLDAGTPMDVAIAKLSARYPDHTSMIAAYRDRWHHMFKGEISGTVSLLARLDDKGIPLFALSNFPGEKFGDFRRSFPFMARFRDVLVSSEEGLIKPAPRIYNLALDRFGLKAATTLFIDDRADNVESAQEIGMRAHHFRTPDDLENRLLGEGLL